MSTHIAAKRLSPQKPTLTRMNLLVNRGHLQQLKELYGVKSESEAVRRAAELVLLAEEGERLSKLTSAQGGLDDVYGRTTGANSIPNEWPEHEPVEEIDTAEEKQRVSAAGRRR